MDKNISIFPCLVIITAKLNSKHISGKPSLLKCTFLTSRSGYSLVRCWKCFRLSCFLVICTWNNTDKWNWNHSLHTLRGNGFHLTVLAQTMECHSGPASPWVPCRPTFSAWVEVPGTVGVPGLIAEPPLLPVEQSLLCHHRPGFLIRVW